MALQPQDLAKSPATMAFSKIRNIARLPEDQVVEFFNKLYQGAVESRDDGDWSRVERLLAHWEDRLTSRTAPDALRFESAPWTPLRKSLARSRVALALRDIQRRLSIPASSGTGERGFRWLLRRWRTAAVASG